MKLNDPFGRMSRRREREYDSLRQSLLKAGLTDRTQAEALIESLKKRSKTGLWIVIPVALVAALLFREYAIFIIGFGILATLWLTNTMRRGQEYIGRYMEEVCDNPQSPDADSANQETPITEDKPASGDSSSSPR